MSLYDRPQHYLDIFGFIIQYPELTAYEWFLVCFNLIGLIGLIVLAIALPIFFYISLRDSQQ